MALEIGEFYRRDGIEIARMRADCAASFPPHTHAEYVVSANLAGYEDIRLDGKRFGALPRTVTIYNPEAVQSSTFARGKRSAEFISLYINPNELVRIAQHNGWLSRTVAPELTQGVFASPALYLPILATYRAARAQHGFDFESALVELTAALFRHSERGTDSGRHTLTDRCFKPVLELMKSHRDATLSLDTLASIANVNKYQLIRAFKSTVGLTPAKYHMQLRLMEARRRLRQGATVQDVSFDLGFYDQSHFINAFRSSAGVSPMRFAAAGGRLKPEVRG